MTTVKLSLPQSIRRHLQEMAAMDGVGVEQFIASAVTEKISAIAAEGYLRERAQRADPAALNAVLDKVPARTPLPRDE